MAEAAQTEPGDPQPARAVWIRAGDFSVGGHPILRRCRALLGRQQRQNGGEGIKAEHHAGLKLQHLALDVEIIADLAAAPEFGTGRRDNLDAEIEKVEEVVAD